MPSKKRKKYKLLLDEGLPLPQSFPNINSYHDIVHIAQSKNRGKKDQDIYKLANNENRIPVVLNVKDFKPMIKQTTMSTIALSPNITDRQADLKIHKALNTLKTFCY